MRLFTLACSAQLISGYAKVSQDVYEDYGPDLSARQLKTVEELNLDKVPESSYKEAGGPGARSAKFKDSGGYIVIEKQNNCWEQCGQSGFCSYCSLSNGSPGFCCNPKSAGGCSAGMVKAVTGSSLRSKNSYQCVVPKTVDDNSKKNFKMLDLPNCWNKCGPKRGWAGRCNYCGENGYCCNQDGRGSCTKEMAQFLKDNKKRGMKCVVPSSHKDDLGMETKLGPKCRDNRKTECRTIADYQGKTDDFEALSDCTRFFPTKTCVNADNMSVDLNAMPFCTTIITNVCASEEEETVQK